MSLGSLCQPCEKNSSVGGVTSQVAGYLCRPVGKKEEVVSGSFASAEDDGVAVDGRAESIVECVQGRVPVIAGFALVEGEEVKGCGCSDVGC